MSNPYEIKIAFDVSVKATGAFETVIVSDESKIRVIVKNAAGGNVILVKGRINSQTDWDTIATITGNTKQVVNVSTYDEAQFECTTYASSSDHVEVLASSFNPAGGSTTIDAPAGGSVSNDTIIFTSSDNTVSIVANPILNTIDFAQSGAGELSKFSATFNNTTDWVLNGSNYEYTVLSATFSNKINPVIETLETIAGTDTVVYPEIIRNASNDVILQVTQTPDNRYTGRINII